MASDPAPNDDSATGGNGGIERIADPENYAKRRRLRQLYDTREYVVTVKDQTMEWVDDQDPNGFRWFTERHQNRHVAEALVDHLAELRPVLKKAGREEEFLNEEIGTVAGETLSIGDILRNRGQVDTEDGRAYIPWRMSMDAYQETADYFEDVAGAIVEKGSDINANPVDPGGRFDG